MKKKLMALFLALSMAVSLVTPAFAAGGLVTSPSEVLASTPAGRAALLSAWDFEVFQKDDLDKAVEEATVNLFEKTQIMLGELDIPGVDFQWQIAVPDQDFWVDIQGEDKLGLDLSYAKVASLLNEDGEAQVRCEVSLGSLVFQGPIITVDVDEDAKPESEPVEEKEPVVLKGPEVVIHDSQPAEPEEPEAEEPAPEAPVVPPVQQEPEVVPEVVPEEPVVVPEEPATELDRSALEESVVAVYNHRNKPLSASTNLIVADVNDTYSVVINYLFENNEQAANPWTATVAAGSDLNQTVYSPLIQGYSAVNEYVELDYQSISENKTINVYYEAAQVPYEVIHYQQNLNDDKYTVVDRQSKTGFTESEIPKDLAKSYDGFYDLPYDSTVTIAADGSTVVEIYYDRYYYLMNFDLNGGHGVEPVYARYGTPIEIGEPEKAGYSFAGWSGTIPATMPSYNTDFTARWSAGDTSYLVVFWYENADDENYSVAGTYGPVRATAGVTVTSGDYMNQNFVGRDSEHFTYNAAKAETLTVAGDGSTVLNVYFTRNVYTVDFVATGVCGIEEHTHGEACRELICTIPVHDHSSCESEKVCELEEHTHTADCMTCGKEEHNHSADCCSLNEHTHDPRACCSKEEHIHGLGCILGCGKSLHVHLPYTWDISSCNKDVCGNAPEHIHGEGNCNYDKCNGYEHVHNEECYKDVAHTHTDGCYQYTCGQISHTHDDTCYKDCGKAEHSHNSNCSNASKENVVKRITAKYDSDISSAWETSPVKGYLDDGYVFKSSVTSKYYSYLEKMPGQDITMTATKWDGNLYTWHYWLQILPGQDTTGLETRTDGGITYYKYHTTTVNGNGISLTYEEDYFPITGFRQRDNTVPSFSNRTAHLHYLRNQYNLKFINNGVIAAEGNYYYQENIAGTYFEPDYPEDFTANEYEFEGWYTSEFATEESRFEFSGATMPATDLVLHANWVPKTHYVNIYRVNDNGTLKNQVGTTQTVPHGSTATDPGAVTHPDSTNYQFISWFYMDGDTEKAFDFSMPINRDMNIYAKWSSVAMVEYTIRYAVEDANGNRTYIADATTGKALADTTKTFEAKTGEDLKADYQSGYFPETNSHSMTMKITGNNEFTFIYVPKQKLPYVVKYLEEGTGEELADSVSKDTRAAIVTEKFVPITGYMPDAYQKRLVLSANEKENVITFWYTKDAEHAPVQVIHYLQNAEGNGYTVYLETADLNSEKNKPYSVSVLTNITGAEFARATTSYTDKDGVKHEENVTASDGKVTSTVTEYGLLLELYYDRGVYPYEFRFLEQGTEKVLATAVTGTDRYGKQVTQNAKCVDGYTCVTGDAMSMAIQIEEGSEAVKNVQVFYYTEQEVTINYVVKGPADCGTVTPTSETVTAVTGTASGSTATAAPGNVYKFVGWYSDPECKQKVSDSVTYVPTKEADAIWPETTTFYAKFDYNLTSLTITKTAPDASDNERFIFNVSGPGIEGGMQIVLKAGESKTISGLKVDGVYTVTEKTDWSWRYKEPTKEGLDANNQIRLEASGNQVAFKNVKKSDGNKWLSAVASAVNKWVDGSVVRS